MEERVTQLGGRLEIQSQPDKGTMLRVKLPIAAAVTG
jgi:signal transduction histidine kinase